jgi:hypothetical protein
MRSGFGRFPRLRVGLVSQAYDQGRIAVVETSLHRQLKRLYARQDGSVEVPLAGYRIDVVHDQTLVEIQHGSLWSIRDKVRQLLKRHDVVVVKPIIAAKMLVQQDTKGGHVIRRRRSPKRGRLLDAFEELVYFTTVFPHDRLTLELVLVDIEEWRYPRPGRRRYRRRDYRIEDQRLVQVVGTCRLRTVADLCRLVPRRLPRPFHTGHLADRMGVGRHIAQRVAYCLRHTGAVRQIGKQGNTRLYEFADTSRAA